MILLKSNHEKKCVGEIKITGSKSETNRLLILKELFLNIGVFKINRFFLNPNLLKYHLIIEFETEIKTSI